MEQFNTSDFQANSRIPVLKRIERCCKAINTLILIFGDLINEANNTHFEGEDVKILDSYKKRFAQLTLCPSMYNLILKMNDYLVDDCFGSHSMLLLRNHPVTELVLATSNLFVSSLWNNCDGTSVTDAYNVIEEYVDDLMYFYKFSHSEKTLDDIRTNVYNMFTLVKMNDIVRVHGLSSEEIEFCCRVKQALTTLRLNCNMQKETANSDNNLDEKLHSSLKREMTLNSITKKGVAPINSCLNSFLCEINRRRFLNTVDTNYNDIEITQLDSLVIDDWYLFCEDSIGILEKAISYSNSSLKKSMWDKNKECQNEVDVFLKKSLKRQKLDTENVKQTNINQEGTAFLMEDDEFVPNKRYSCFFSHTK